MATLEKMSIANKSIRYKMSIAFSLMTIIPLLTFLYCVYPDIFEGRRNTETISLILFLSMVIAVLGLIIARRITDAVVDLSISARKVAGGEYERRVAVSTDDDLGNISQSINSMSQKIKSNLDELKSYGQNMKDLNLNIHKKVLALSSLLQIGDIISAGSTQIDLLLNMAIEKAAHLFETGYGILYMPRNENENLVMKASYNVENEALEALVIKRGGRGILDRLLISGSTLQIDKATKTDKEVDDFRRTFNTRNMIAVPLYSGKSLLGLFVIGDRLSDYRYAADDVDLVCVFAKHITMAIESDILNRKNEQLVTRDDLTGLFNKNYIVTRLEEEIKRAIFYQRPCSFIVLSLDNFKIFREERGELVAEEALRRIAKVVRDNTSPIGKAARIGGDEFAMLLPEKNKREAAYVAEELRKKIESANVLKEGKAALTASIGVSENPIDGVTSEEIFKRAEEAVKEAKAAGKNRVVS